MLVSYSDRDRKVANQTQEKVDALQEARHNVRQDT